ncbi:MAG TPA: MCP four helix bundle domain-containing protein, partial [Pseudoduganella sp.]
MNFRNMKVGARLALGYAIVLALLLLIMGAGLLKMHDMQARINRITEFNNVQIANLSSMQENLLERAIAIRNIGLLPGIEEMRLEAQQMRKFEARYAEKMALLNKSFEDPSTSSEEKALLAAILEQERTALPLIAEAEKLGLSNEDEAATAILMDKVRPVQVRWQEAMSKLIALETRMNTEEAQAAEAAYDNAVRLMLILAAVALAVGISAAVLVTRALLSQLGGEPTAAAAIAARIADGDLTVDVPVKAGDTGSMMFAMRNMRDKLSAIV